MFIRSANDLKAASCLADLIRNPAVYMKANKLGPKTDAALVEACQKCLLDISKRPVKIHFGKIIIFRNTSKLELDILLLVYILDGGASVTKQCMEELLQYMSGQLVDKWNQRQPKLFSKEMHVILKRKAHQRLTYSVSYTKCQLKTSGFVPEQWVPASNDWFSFLTTAV